MRRWTKAGLGLFFAGLVIQAFWLLWGGTRHWVPIDMPITLSPGQITTKEFKINFSAPYEIKVVVQRNMPFDAINCLLGIWSNWEQEPTRCENTPSVIEAKWNLFSGARIITQGDSNVPGWSWEKLVISRNIGIIQGESGRNYTLEVNFLKDGSRLAVCSPHLQIAVSDDWFSDIMFARVTSNLVTTVLWLLGIPMILISIVRGRRKES